MPLLIQGVFFHNHLSFLFGGVIFSSITGSLSGFTKDPLGDAELDQIILGDDAISFQKRYRHRDDVINYSLKKQADGSWRGVYRGDKVGTGEAHCLLTEVPEEFFWEEGR